MGHYSLHQGQRTEAMTSVVSVWHQVYFVPVCLYTKQTLVPSASLDGMVLCASHCLLYSDTKQTLVPSASLDGMVFCASHCLLYSYTEETHAPNASLDGVVFCGMLWYLCIEGLVEN